jgi:hypothetical protein
MSDPAHTHDADDFDDFTMSLKDWLEILDDDVDEAVECLDSDSQQIKQLVSFLRAKAAAIELEEPGEDQEEIERDEEESE